MTYKRKKWCFFSLLALLFLLMFLMNALSPWIADDYFYAFSFATNEKLSSFWDIFPSLKAHASIMNGRYTPHFLVQLFTLLPWWVFDIANSFVFVLMIMGMHRLVCGARKYDIAMLCALIGAVFVLIPGFGSCFLWMAGSCNYLWCDVLLIWLLVPFADAILNRPHEPSMAVQLLMIPAALFFGNMSQNVSVSGVMLMVLAMLWIIYKHKKVYWWMICSALAALAGWVLCMIAPADIALIKYGTSGAGIILNNFQLAANMMVKYGTIPSIVLLAFSAFCWYDGTDRKQITIAIGFFLAAIACNYSMAFSWYYPDRAFTGTALMLICGCAFTLPKLFQPRLKMMLALSLGFMMVTTLLYALPDMYNCYAKYFDREAQVEQALSNGETSITTFGIVSRSRFDCFHEIHDLSIKTDGTSNVYYARYHGLDSVSVERFE